MLSKSLFFVFVCFSMCSFGQSDVSKSKIFIAENNSGLFRNYFLNSKNVLYQIELIPDTFLCARFHTKPTYTLGIDHLVKYLTDFDCPSYFEVSQNTRVYPEAIGLFKGSFEIDQSGEAFNPMIIESPNSKIDESFIEKVKKLKNFTIPEFESNKLNTKILIQMEFNCPEH